MSVWNEWLDASLDKLAEHELLRTLDAVEPVDAVHVRADGRRLTLFSSNDYLGLSAHPKVRQAAADAAEQGGLGPRGSALVCGYTTAHEALERELAELKGCEAGLLFPTGFAANLAVVSSLGGSGVAIFSDSLNHASIIDGCRLARRRGATLEVYPHGDMAALEEMLANSEASRKLIVTDSVFSMDGDLAPLDRLAELKAEHDALLVVDEAHGTLVFGEHGGGVAEHFGVEDAVDVHVGTLSKAVGALGGFAATSQKFRQWIFNRGRAFVFSTAQAVPVVEAARAAIRVARDEPEIRRRLWERIAQLGDRLGRELTSPIVPIVLGDEARALAASDHLLDEGFHVIAIRPPTVPPGTSRLRVALSAAHAPEDIDRLADTLEAIT
ncbi:8-amino-7-oxononanoate synthase [Persicimonas caeni]|uniref:8-amino-7-oxononanoate synthase n=1 Tax=Persicimonas caeni TaxID=2292766 RepID=A0A4Y6Q0T4_PERCE|nr:8-amino-7-oxononanoate synthase [Persicimonas caeni]QDG54100.1 8-amino-7-oxononanoate synthase [Persicimonas caeni]QED35321.1 8-amino-7-oxononanoate synthase [Persicimonas caeni]